MSDNTIYFEKYTKISNAFDIQPVLFQQEMYISSDSSLKVEEQLYSNISVQKNT